MFCQMELDGLEPNIVTWISMLSSHARCGHHEETLHLYGVMKGKGIGTTVKALAVVVSVCADSGALDKGEVIHGNVVKGGFENYLFVKNLYVCMYGKHGTVGDVENLFSEMESKNIVSCNALIDIVLCRIWIV
ncbi:putative pentatricopeptide repeat-containing protein [Camellia lanceoleosa]|uniref:Pentatricopeptide repeat-containing protein n=1 Tax=Camellia lanceoleosa TaxID=1840588 RepID=A0ACC0GU54_9ERIC|nr:putative pentatricopeptide repeat-containing protein [Camellia lanceoleosa]